MDKHAIFLSGPIGAGKTTLGRAVAARLGGGFVDGDDCSDNSKPWYAGILTTSRNIMRAGLAVLETKPVVVIAYPLGCSTWIYYRRKFGDAGVAPVFVSLRASYAAITAADRGRVFSDGERARIQAMLLQGYGERPFSDLIFDTDRAGFEETAAQLAEAVTRLMA